MRKEYIDYLRTMAITAVIVIHVTGLIYNQFGEISSTTSWWLANILNSASHFAVP